MDFVEPELIEMTERRSGAGGEDSKETEKLLEENGGEHRLLGGSKTKRLSSDMFEVPSDSTEGSAAEHSCTNPKSILADSKQERRKLTGFLPLAFYRRTDGKMEQVAPFAVILLLVLLAVYVLNQADRLVLPVVIPNGLRCDVGKEDCGIASNASSNGSDPTSNTTHDCIQFNDDQQGLLTGRYVRIYVSLEL